MCISKSKDVFCVNHIKLYQHIGNNTENDKNIIHNKLLKA